MLFKLILKKHTYIEKIYYICKKNGRQRIDRKKIAELEQQIKTTKNGNGQE